MKKILVVLSLICFVAVNVTNAQTSASAPAAKTEKKEAVTATSTPESSHAKACCKGGNMKSCTAAEKAKCDSKAKTEAAAPAKVESKSTVVKN